jgi:hypothetical protein
MTSDTYQEGHMENVKIKRIATVLLCIGAFLSISLNAYQFQQIRNLSQDINSKIFSNNKKKSEAAQEKNPFNAKDEKQYSRLTTSKTQPVNKDAAGLQEQIAEAKEELAMVNKRLLDDAAKIAEEKKALLEHQKKSQKMYKIYKEDPSYKNMRRNANRAGFNSQYADLFKRLNLPVDKVDKLKDIFADEIEEQQDLWTQRSTDGSASLTQEQEEELSKRSQALNQKYESKKSDLLGKDGYAEYQAFNETAGERYIVKSLMESNSSDEKLTADQKEQLIAAMHEEAKNVPFPIITSDELAANDQKEMLARQIDYQSRMDDAYLKAARGILSASQYEQLETYLKKQRDQQKLMMESSMISNAQTEDEGAQNKKPE